MDDNKLIEIGMVSQKFNDILNINLPIRKIYRSKGLPAHLVKQKHFDCLKHIDDIPDMIKSPDYIGINPNENGDTIELIKVFDKNILVGIKFDCNENYFYVSTMYSLQESKLDRRLYSGRVKKISID